LRSQSSSWWPSSSCSHFLRSNLALSDNAQLRQINGAALSGLATSAVDKLPTGRVANVCRFLTGTLLSMISINRQITPIAILTALEKIFVLGRLGMDQKRRANLQELKSGSSVPRGRKGQRCEGFSRDLRRHVATLGPKPRKSLAAFVDLGLSDGEIARYYQVPRNCISKLCQVWGIR